MSADKNPDKNSIQNSDMTPDSVRNFIDTVTCQIRWNKAKAPIARELEEHIMDQRDDFENGGMDSEEALISAVKEMGDPVEIGKELDRVHRPAFTWSLICMVIAASIVGILFQAAMLISRRSIGINVDSSLLYALDSQINSSILIKQIVFSCIGIAMMLMVRVFDYRVLKKHTLSVAAIFSIMLIAGAVMAQHRYAGVVYISGVVINMRILILLAIPVYALLIYRYKGQGYIAVCKLAAWAALYIFIALKLPSISDVVILAGIFYVMFMTAVFKGWFKVSKKMIAALSFCIAAVIILMVTGIVFSDTIANKVLRQYQVERLRSVFGVGEQNDNYTAEKAFEIMSGNSSFSFEQKNLAEAISTVPELGTDYTIVGVTAAFGGAGAVLVIMLILFITGVSIRVTMLQKDELGKTLGLGCSLVFLWETLISVLMALNIIPPTMALVPFISQGGSQIIVMYILMEIVMSVQRYRNVAEYGDKNTFKNGSEYKEIKIAGYRISMEKQR